MIITISWCYDQHEDYACFYHRATGVWCYKEQKISRWNLRY